MNPSSHLSAGELAGYVDRTLANLDRNRIEHHLADCDVCRQELVAVGRIVHGQPKRRWLIAASGLAAAAVILLLSWPGGQERTAPGPVLRGNGGEGVPIVDAISPPVGGQVEGTRITFTWHPVGATARYQVTLLDDRGTVLWSGATSDTSLTTARPRVVSAVYYWYVDALLPDGRSATSGARELRPAP